jgi:hypothetical protein
MRQSRSTAFVSLVFAVLFSVPLAGAACSTEQVTFRTPAALESCEEPGDEDGNGLADCDDAACAGLDGCAAATCTDGRRNGEEADVDCGGRCPACGDAALCAADADCTSGLCGSGRCVRLPGCREIRNFGYSRGDGLYAIDPDGPTGAPPFQVKCDMTFDGGGWTRFNWVLADYPLNADPFEQLLSQCSPTGPICRGRIPVTVTPADFMVKDLGDGDYAAWHFTTASNVSLAALGAFRDKAIICLANGTPWQPYRYTGTEGFCGTNASPCDSFTYTNSSMCNNYRGWHSQLDDDTGCYAAAFKIGMAHPGYETIGCELPDVNYLDDGPSTAEDRTGELYYR